MNSQPNLHRFAHQAMNTTFEAHLVDDDANYARQAAHAIFREIDRLEQLLSRFNSCSEIAMINRLRPGECLTVTRDVFDCLYLARQIFDDTGGLFDVSIGPVIRFWRDVRNEVRPFDEAVLEQARARVGLQHLEFRVTGGAADGNGESTGGPQYLVVGLSPDACEAGIDIDLGGIGKGYALDKCLELLEDWGIRSALLSAGGSTVLAIGSGPDGDGWKLGIGGVHAGPAGAADRVILRDAAMSGSGPELQGEHIFNPVTGRPGRVALQAWSIGPSASVCDALSTAFIMMAPEAVEAYCRDFPQSSAYIAYEGEEPGKPQVRTWGAFFGTEQQ